ncbi:hypothetical protein CAURIS_09770 [Corynebacterium auris]|nr:hypothetical protein CAURIS_09770 [Corynebacterium auris]
MIEEFENGLHPSPAGKMVRLLEDSHAVHGTQSLVTTYSPALLGSIEGT